MKKPTFANLIDATAVTSKMTKKHTRLALENFFQHLSDAVWATGRVSVPGLASFRVRTRKARNISNPQTGEPMTLPRSRAVIARVASAWRHRG